MQDHIRLVTGLSHPANSVKQERARQRGYSLIEVAFGVAIVAAVAVIVAVFIGDVNRSLNASQAQTQLNTLIASAKQYRSTFAQGGLYTGITVSKLAENGYATAGIDGTNSLNVYGLDVTVAIVSGNKDATITYATPTVADCNQIRSSFVKGTTTFVIGVKAASCSAGVLTLTID